MSPKISIITPNYNGEKYLERTILSVLDQKYPNLEYIIIDGASSDGSLEIINKYSDNLTYWISEPDNGMYDAIAKGMEKATGEILAWLNSDDIYLLNSLHLVAKIFAQSANIKCITGNPTFINENGYIIFSTKPISPSYIRFLNFEYRWIQQESTFFRKELINYKLLSEFRSYKYAGDLFLWLSILKCGEKIKPVETCFSAFRYRKNQLSQTNNFQSYLDEANSIIENEIRKLDKITLQKLRGYKFKKKLLELLPGIRNMHMVSRYLDNLSSAPESLILNRDF